MSKSKKRRQRKQGRNAPTRAGSIDQVFQSAMQHHAAGQLAQAEKLYDKVLTANPNHPLALHLLGALNHHGGQPEIAVDLISRAVALKPDFPEAHNNLGNALMDMGQTENAAASYRNALDNNPDYAKAHFNLGNVLRIQGQLDEAASSYGKALSVQSDYVEAYHNLGIVFQDQGRHGEAVDSFQKVLEIRRDFVAVHRNLGESLQYLGRMEEAIGSYQRALEETPDVAEIHNNIGIAYKSLERFEVAVVSFHKAIGLKPAYGEAHYNMAACLKSLDQLDAAIVCYRQALAINPNFADGYTNLGIALGECGLLDEAISCFQMVCQLEPTWAGAYSNMLMMEQYRPGHNAQSLLDLHRQWADRYGGHITRHPLPPVSAPDPDRALRIGFVSADLGRHPVGYFIVGLFEHLVKNDIETVVYSDRSADDLTDRIRNATDIWHDVQGMSDQQLGQMIVADEIDILFDLAGHLGTRLLVFAAKPAPLQVTWAGYIGTTGLPAMDYLLSDAHSTPAQEEQFYSEKIIRMADGWLCYSPPEYAPQVGPLPVRRNDSVTYGSFSNPVKINQDVVAVWSQILARTENSRLFIKCKGGDSIGFKNRLLGMFEAHGIDPSRLLLEGRSPHAELLACYNKVDLALDPFPYSGGLTTYEALWMGVPVITLPGDTFASRHSASHLMTLGLPELVAAGPQQYVELAVGLANDTDRLAALRADLRQMMASSPICDYQKFARGFSDNMRGIWRAWCA